MGGVVDLGFTDRPPTLAGAREGLSKRSFDRDGDAFILWARGFGLRKGDRLNVALLGPNGEVMAETARDIDRPRAVEFGYVGKRRRGAWPAGRYRGLVSVDRGGAPLDAREIELTLD